MVPENSGRVAVDVLGAVQTELHELARIAADHPGEVHHFREPDHAAAPQQVLEIARSMKNDYGNYLRLIASHPEL